MNYRINEQLKMGKTFEVWGKNKNYLHVTLCVTQDCNFACSYCYCLNKNQNNAMNYEIAAKTIDFLLTNKLFLEKDGIMLDFMGGEPTLEIDLISRICDYFVIKVYEMDHKWKDMYRFMITTNGYLYSSSKVQEYIKRHAGHIQIAISLDGTKLKHDATRKLKDGRGTYEIVLKNTKMLLKQFYGAQTKATFSSKDIHYLKDSIVHLWEVGFDVANASIVYEDTWRKEDSKIFEQQLILLADYILQNELWNECSTNFFAPNIGLPLSFEEAAQLSCGAGNCIAVDGNGLLYPCHRFIDFTQKEGQGYSIGDIFKGINVERLRPLYAASRKNRMEKKCRDCFVASGCGGCVGYDYSITGNFFKRTTFNCEMHKANARVNEYFWDQYEKKTGYISPQKLHQVQYPGEQTRYLYIMQDPNIVMCNYNVDIHYEKMPREVLIKSVQVALEKKMIPVIIGKEVIIPYQYNIVNESIDHWNTIVVKDFKSVYLNDDYIADNLIILFSKDDFETMDNLIDIGLKKCKYINLIIKDLGEWKKADLEQYKNALFRLVNQIIAKKINRFYINILHAIMNITEMMNCNAGVNSFAVAPNGKFYICPAYFYENPQDDYGNIYTDLKMETKGKLLKYEDSPLCCRCDHYSCKRCVYLSEITTGASNIPASIQCKISSIEKEASAKLQKYLIDQGIRFKNIIDKQYFDPMERIIHEKKLDIFGLSE